MFLLLFLFACNPKKEHQTTANIPGQYKGPIIDMHIHADKPSDLPPEKAAMCIPLSTLVAHHDPKVDFEEAWFEIMSNPNCKDPIWSPLTYEDYLNRVENQLNTNNVTAVTSGSVEIHAEWKSNFSDRIIPSLEFRLGRENISADSLKQVLILNGIKILGEVSNQYAGISPNDPRMFPYYEVAQELDIAVGIHLGSGSPGAPFLFSPDYIASYSNPLLLEEVLKKFPKLRVYAIHYGEPFIDEMITMLYHYPHLYIDLGGIQWCYPKEYFYEYHLKKLVTAGFGKRIMFGSDAFIWPELMEKSIAIINEADFLTYEQKADIFYNNATRFLRLK